MTQAIFIILAVIVCLVFLESYRESRNFKIRNYVIPADKLAGVTGEIRCVLIADLHDHEYGKDNERLIRAVRSANPDFILVAGDLMTGSKGTAGLHIAESFLLNLSKEYPVFYGFGNHESKLLSDTEGTGFKRYLRDLRESGVTILDNSSVCFKARGAELRVSGLTFPKDSYARFKAMKCDSDFIKSSLGEASPSDYQILIAHNPSGSESFAEWGADLAVSGHLHGGVARFWGGRGLITPQFRIFVSKAVGCFKNGRGWLIVSGGLGTHSVPFRLANPPELVVIHLIKK